MLTCPCYQLENWTNEPALIWLLSTLGWYFEMIQWEWEFEPSMAVFRLACPYLHVYVCERLLLCGLCCTGAMVRWQHAAIVWSYYHHNGQLPGTMRLLVVWMLLTSPLLGESAACKNIIFLFMEIYWPGSQEQYLSLKQWHEDKGVNAQTSVSCSSYKFKEPPSLLKPSLRFHLPCNSRGSSSIFFWKCMETNDQIRSTKMEQFWIIFFSSPAFTSWFTFIHFGKAQQRSSGLVLCMSVTWTAQKRTAL